MIRSEKVINTYFSTSSLVPPNNKKLINSRPNYPNNLNRDKVSTLFIENKKGIPKPQTLLPFPNGRPGKSVDTGRIKSDTTLIYNEHKKFYSVYFSNTVKITGRSYYDVNGDVLETIRYYSDSALSPFIRIKINQKYPGKKIYGITEVTTADDLILHILLEDNFHLYQITSDSKGNIKMVKKFNKSQN